jgi:hypothetical protein
MDWPCYTAACAAMQLEIMRMHPDALVRIDVLGERWGCSVLPAGGAVHFDGTDVAEVYGEGIDPLEALDDAYLKLEALMAAAA